jgi:transcriptional regulator with XRE-family HTH domain
MAAVADRAPIGVLLRDWRERRNLSQLALAAGSAVSTRHLSFIETGRSRPSREMVLHLADRLAVPLRERNRLLLAAGYAPAYGNRPLADGEMAPVRQALDRFLAAHEPYPAVVLDRLHNIVAANRAVQVLTEAVAPDLLEPPANALRIALHPEGLAPRTVNFDEWSGNLLRRLRGEVVVTGDGELSGCTRSLPATRTSTSIPGRRPFRRARTSSSRSASGPRPECSPSSAP